MVKETGLYDLLGVAPNATKDQIRKAYYKKARACHPDKHPGDKDKEAEFKAVSDAYQVLFDDQSRATYDRLGKDGLQGGQAADPKDVFAAIFGGPEFEPFIGTLRMCAPVDETLEQEAHEADRMLYERKEELRELRQTVQLSPADMEGARIELERLSNDAKQKHAKLDEASMKVQQQRVRECSAFLRTRIQQYASAGEDERGAVMASIRQDFEKLQKCNMGDPILHTIGYVYVYHTQKVLGKHGVGVHQVAGWFEDCREGFHKFSEVTGAIGSGVRFLRASYKLSKDAQAQQGEAPQTAKLTDEDREWYEDMAKKRMMHIVWTLTKNDIESTLREVIDSVLLDTDVTTNTTVARSEDIEHVTKLPPQALKHAEAIMEMGRIFMEGMPFDEFICKDDPPTAMGKATKDIEDRARNAGLDVDGMKRGAKDAGDRTAAAASEAAAAAGNAINKLFGWKK